MPGLKEVRQRIKAVKGIGQVTKAMKMVATVEMRRIQDRLLQVRPYVDTLYDMAVRLAAAGTPGNEPLHPLLAQAGEGDELILVIGSDRGLCGGFNTGLFRHVMAHIGAGKPVIGTVGRKVRDYFGRQRFDVIRSYEKLPFPMPWVEAQRLSNELVSQYSFRRLSRLHLAYQRFVRPGVSRPVVKQWLPLKPERHPEAAAGAATAQGPAPVAASALRCEPSVAAVLDLVLPRALTAQLHRALLESQASERGARMMAMDSATTNASELSRDLTLLANKLRQGGITKELLEITTGAEALNN